MALEIVKPRLEEINTVNLLLYGAPKSGKSTAAASAPGPVLFGNAEAPSRLRYARRVHGNDKIHEVRIKGLADLNEIELAAVSGKLKEQTVVIDPIGDVHRVLMEQQSSRAIRPDIRIYGDVMVHIERFCRALCGAPVNVVFVAHEQPEKVDEGFEYLPLMGTNNTKPAQKLMAMVDVIAYCGRRETDEGVEYVAQLFDGKGRRGGDGTGVLGRVEPLDLTDWITRATGDEDETKEAA